MKKPFFTIVTPTLNSEKYLKECIDSVENQSFKDWEHIFIDSFSTDKTRKILKDYKKRNPKKVFIYQYPKAGISDAFNKGISHARGKYLNLLGSDDLLEEKALEIVHKRMQDERYSWCYGDVKIIDGFGKLIRYRKQPLYNPKLMIYFLYLCYQSIFMKNTLYQKWGKFDTNLKNSMDHEYLLRIKDAPLKIDAVVCLFRKDGSNATSREWKNMLNEKLKVNLMNANLLEKPIVLIINRIIYLKKLINR